MELFVTACEPKEFNISSLTCRVLSHDEDRGIESSVITLKPAMRDQRKTGHGRKPSRTQFVLALRLL
jgi:hypothetical protein